MFVVFEFIKPVQKFVFNRILIIGFTTSINKPFVYFPFVHLQINKINDKKYDKENTCADTK